MPKPIIAFFVFLAFVCWQLLAYKITAFSLKAIGTWKETLIAAAWIAIPLLIAEFWWVFSFYYACMFLPKFVVYIIATVASVVGGTLSMYIFFEEVPNVWSIIGIALALLGIIVAIAGNSHT